MKVADYFPAFPAFLLSLLRDCFAVFFFWKIKINTEFPSGCFRREIEKADYQTESGTTEAGNKYRYRGVYKKGLVAVTWNFISINRACR